MLIIFALLCGCVYAVVEERHTPGNITSPNYPQNYPSVQNHTWIFKRQTGKWAVIFDDFDIQNSKDCKNDFLYLRDLRDWSHSVKLCGTEKPSTFVTRTSGLQIDFHSDWIEERRGFRADVLYGKDTATLEYQINPRTGQLTSGPVDRNGVHIFTAMTVSVICLSVVLLALGTFTLFYLLKYKRRAGVTVWVSKNGNVNINNKRRRKPIFKKYIRNHTAKSKTDVNGNGLFRLQNTGPMHKMVPNPSYVYNSTYPKHIFVRLNSEDSVGEHSTTEPYTDIKFNEFIERNCIRRDDV